MVTEVETLKFEADKEKKSSAHAAATLAATNAARQAEMEMKIEKLEKETEFKKREIDAVSYFGCINIDLFSATWDNYSLPFHLIYTLTSFAD